MDVKATVLVVGLATITLAGCANRERTVIRRETETERVAPQPGSMPESVSPPADRRESTTVIHRRSETTQDSED